MLKTMNKQNLKFVNTSPHPDPAYAHKGDSGFDLRCWIEDDAKDLVLDNANAIRIEPFTSRLVRTGLFFNLPPFTEIQVRPRSGLALKQGITVLNTPGTIDSTYTNEVKVILYNASNKPVIIEDGDRIAQAVLMPVFNGYDTNLVKVDSIVSNSDRNLDGFGSTGVK